MAQIRWLLRALLFSGWVLLPQPALAEPEGDAQKFVQDSHVALTDLIRRKSDAQIDVKFDEVLDYELLAQETLREFWADRTPAERERFQCVLKGLVTDAHRRNLSKTLGYEVSYQGTRKASRGYLVTTEAKSTKNRREEPISIAYLVHKRKKSPKDKQEVWLVLDIVTEGSSLVENYRNQFRRIMKKDGFGELIQRMSKKLGKAADVCSQPKQPNPPRK